MLRENLVIGRRAQAESFSVADGLRTSFKGPGLVAPNSCLVPNGWYAPGGIRTPDHRLRRPDEPVPASSSASQPLATTRDEAGADSRDSQVFAPFTEDSADRLRTLLKDTDVAARLAVSTKTVYALCARGRLRHVRVLNSIRVAPDDLEAFVSQHAT